MIDAKAYVFFVYTSIVSYIPTMQEIFQDNVGR